MKKYVAQCATDRTYQLAEGPLWDHLQKRVLWVDIPTGNVHEGELRGQTVHPTRTRHVDSTVGAVAVATDGGLIVAGHQAVYRIDAAGVSTEIARLVPAGQQRRLNDGKCDPAGRFLVGTLALSDQVQESLYQIDPSGDVAVIDDDLHMSNGLAWSPDGHIMYSVDTTPGILWERPYDPATGRCGARREAFRVTDGSPDGICADTDGNLWVAVWGTGEVRHFTPHGELIGVVTVAAPYASCVTFVGSDLGTLLISTAIDDLPDKLLTAYPQSGSLFLAEVDARGLPTSLWHVNDSSPKTTGH